MIYTDGIHLISSTSESELHRFAEMIGLKKAWFQNKPGKHPHYDLTSIRMSNKAISWGANLVSRRDIIEMLRSNND
jgi:hypothetical protein